MMRNWFNFDNWLFIKQIFNFACSIGDLSNLLIKRFYKKLIHFLAIDLIYLYIDRAELESDYLFRWEIRAEITIILQNFLFWHSEPGVTCDQLIPLWRYYQCWKRKNLPDQYYSTFCKNHELHLIYIKIASTL